jgi:hypothetical protein
MSNTDTVREAFKVIAEHGLVAMLDIPHTDDITMHVPTLGIQATGEAQIREQVIDFMEQVNLRVELSDLIADGLFVTCLIGLESDLRPEPTTGVEVFRFDGDRIAEIWALTPPLPA